MARRLARLRGLARIRRNLALFRAYGTPVRVQTLPLLVTNRETSNFTYDVANADEIGRVVAEAVGIPEAEGIGYVRELEQDRDLRRRLQRRSRGRGGRSGRLRYGRRVGWYAAVRARKPRFAVETGTHDGLGTAVLLRGLERNAAEGREGILVSLDVREGAGCLVDDTLSRRLELRIGDSRTLLAEAIAGRTVDFFLHDSDHSYEHETFEFETILPAAAAGAVLLSDNAHAGTAFREFCDRHGLPYWFVPELPRRHFYPGAGIGLTVAD